jgi:hypothetical protein
VREQGGLEAMVAVLRRESGSTRGRSTLHAAAALGHLCYASRDNQVRFSDAKVANREIGFGAS